MSKTTITINRAPVLTLWAAVVAERLGFDDDTALTLGKAVAGLTAQSKGRHLGIFKPPKLEGGRPARRHGLGEDLWIDLCGRSIPAKNTTRGVRAVMKDVPIEPEQVRGYLSKAFGDDLAAARSAMEALARSKKPDQLAVEAFGLYEQFRPQIAPGQHGWGQKGDLKLDLIRSLSVRAK